MALLKALLPPRADSAASRRFLLAELSRLALALLVAVGLRIAWVAAYNIDPNDGRFDDSVFYHNVGHLLALGLGYGDPYGRGPTAQWPPVYPLALAALYKPFGWHLVLAKALNIAFAAATVVLVYLFARRIFDRRAGALAALVLAVFPGQIYFSTLVLAETMFALVFLLVLWLTLVWTVDRRELRWWAPLALGVLVGASALVRAEGAFLVFVLAAVWAFTVRPWRVVARCALLLAVGATLALTPWTVRNAIVLHTFAPLRPDATNAISRGLDPEAANLNIDRERAPIGDLLREHLQDPVGYFTLAKRKLGDLYGHDADGVRFMHGAAPARASGTWVSPLTDEEADRWSLIANRYYFGAGAAALIGLAAALLRRDRAALVLFMAALGWTLLFTFFQPTSRYHFPLGPLIAVMAGGFLALAWDAAAAAGRWLLAQVRGERPPLARAERPGS